ncbi:MAG: hypothetical protein HOE48_08970 [Candidatus Latescibacteria bacterium]|nr:hypothetical protein [Candidatus Latescibacterota bacterium]MBT4138034.1 hypothetical protein [Candidatus Latescibacterota bacterium]MBT5829683.1 hypothetical protein [Candidatus Latescibacterota bacterium]
MANGKRQKNISKLEYDLLVGWAVVQLVGGDVWVKGAWNARWGVGTARAGEGGLRL